MANIISLALAAITFYVFPQNLYLILQSTFGQVIENEKGYGEKIKHYTNSKLTLYSKSFLQLSKTFKSLAIPKERLNQEDIGNLIDAVVNKSCTNCEQKKHCWQSIFYSTYKSTTSLIENIEEGCVEKIAQSKENLQQICEKSDLFIENTYTYFEFYKTNMVWHNKIAENKSLIADQLFDISNIFGNIVNELSCKNRIFAKNRKYNF